MANILDQIVRFVLEEHNGKGENLTDGILGADSSKDDLSMYYEKKETAERAAKLVIEKFGVYAVVLEQFAGPIRLFIYQAKEV